MIDELDRRTLVRAGIAGAVLATLALVAATPSNSAPAGHRAVDRDVLEPRRFTMAQTFDGPLEHEQPRRLLGLYDSSETTWGESDDERPPRVPDTSGTSQIHRVVELPLNHLGLAIDYLDVATQKLPDPARMRRYRGVVTWFRDESMKHPEAYLRWILAQLRLGTRIVVLERLGARRTHDGQPVSRELVADVFSALGARLGDSATDDPSAIRIAWFDSELLAFERPLPARLPHFEALSARKGTRVLARLERSDLDGAGRSPGGTSSDAAFVSDAGGFVGPGLVIAEERLGDRYVQRWLLNPFDFFARALAIEDWPRVDFTTKNGKRLFYSHIDGDGLEMITELDYETRCGAVVRDQILERYPLPFTASVVVGLTAPPPIGKGTPRDVEVARSIFALDNVEIGSHGLAHPMNWRGGDRAEVSVPGLADYHLDGAHEVAESVAYIDEHLAPPDKRCEIMLWTGWCNPSESQLDVAYELGLRNLNGGDPRMDAHYPSYAHLVAPVHPVGNSFQFFTSAANDFILTDEWTPPYYRFRNVVQTFVATGQQRRILPVNVYFHFYIARNRAGLSGLRDALDWALEQDLAPVFASEYVDIARDFHHARLSRPQADTWRVHKGPALRTVRFAGEVFVDLERSREVLGYVFNRDLGVTYVHLTDAPTSVIAVGQVPDTSVYLREATHDVDALNATRDRIAFSTRGVGNAEFDFANAGPNGSFRLEVAGSDAVAEPDRVIRATSDGVLRLQLSLTSGKPVSVALRRIGE